MQPVYRGIQKQDEKLHDTGPLKYYKFTFFEGFQGIYVDHGYMYIFLHLSTKYKRESQNKSFCGH